MTPTPAQQFALFAAAEAAFGLKESDDA